MRNRTQSWLIAAACGFVWGLMFSQTGRAAEIVAVTNDQGQTIFINRGEPRAHPDWSKGAEQPARAPTASLPPQAINQLVEETANRFQVDPQLVHAIIKVESQYDPNAVSSKGAMGLMQLIPKTAKRFGVENPFNPKENIEGGVGYLKHLLNLYGGDLSLSLAAYNAGEHAVERFGGIPSFAETRDYVQKVTDIYQLGSTQSGTYAGAKKPQPSPIIRYVDEQGVVHYTNVE
jgi:soluble lytic murein transglycosylase-like protein